MLKLSLLFLLISMNCYAKMYTEVRDASSTNIPAAYTDSGAELINNMKANNLCCINKTGSTLRLCFRSNSASACGDDWYLEDGDGFCFEDHMLASNLYAKGDSGVISSGVLACHAWRN